MLPYQPSSHRPTSATAARPPGPIVQRVFLLGLCAAMAACSQLSSMADGMTPPAVPASASGAALDTMFVTRAMQSDMLEVAASRLALTRSTNPQIHRFARQMVDDHTSNGTELRQLAARLDLATTVPQPLPADEMKLQQLQNADDAQFEALYVKLIGVGSHTEAVTLFRQEAAQGGNSELRAFASRKVPLLEHHLAMAKALSSSSSMR